MKITLYGVRAIRVHYKKTLKEQTKKEMSVNVLAKYAALPETSESEVARIMTGREVGHFVGLDYRMFSGDCLTNVQEDAYGAVRALEENPLPNIKAPRVFTVTIELD